MELLPTTEYFSNSVKNPCTFIDNAVPLHNHVRKLHKAAIQTSKGTFMVTRYLPENTDEDDVENQAIYDALSRLTGVDRPALVFRTIAATPGALAWCWQRMAPLYEQGQVQRTGWRIGPALALPSGLQISQEALTLLGIDDSSKQKLEIALDAYNRVNPCNLIAIGVLNHVLQDSCANTPAGSKQRKPEAWTPPEPIIPITKMIPPEAISDELARLIEQISLDQPSSGQPQLVPSLYRHLANVPSFLALAFVLLRPLLLQGQLASLVTQVREQALQESQRLADSIASTPDEPLPDQTRIQNLIERFSWKIPEMMVVGEILRRALP